METGTGTRGARPLPVQSIEDLQAIGVELSKGKMLGDINPSQGFTIACICHQTGQSYNEYGETYHILGGRPTMRAEAMLANLHKLGGKHEVLSRTSEKAEIKIQYHGNENTFTLTADEVYSEPFCYRGKPNEQAAELKKPLEQRNMKDKYATPRSRMQMLWARLVSDAVRAVCPEANQGQYTPEEVEDFPEQAAPAQSSEAPHPIEQKAQKAPVDICPVPGKLLGKRWDSMDLPTLKFARDQLQHESLTDEHRQEIQKEISKKENS